MDKRLFAAVLGCLLLLLVGRGTAFGHASLARAEPRPDEVVAAAPERVVIWFTEPIEGEFSEILVFAADGTQVDNGDSRLLADDPQALVVTLRREPPLGEGRYTVSWKNVSTVDGHIVRSSYLFSVGRPVGESSGEPGGAADEAVGAQEAVSLPLEPVVRWLVLLAIAGIFGGLWFDLWVVRPSLARFEEEAIGEEYRRGLSSRVLNLTWIFVILFLVGSVGQLLLQSYFVNGELGVGSVVRFLNGAYWGQVWAWRMGLFLVVFGLLPLPARWNPGQDWGRSWERPREWLALVVCAGVMLTLSLVSHAFATIEIRVTAVIVDYLHLLAAGAWVGGLFHLAGNMPYFLWRIPVGRRQALLAVVVPRFSALAIVCVTTLVLTGLFSSYAQVTVLAALNTPYGRALLVKLALIAPLLALGAVNLLSISGRLAREWRAGEQLGRTVRGEAALAVLVLLAVGVLVTLEPGRQTASRALAEEPEPAVLTLEDTAEGLTGRLVVDPAGVGEKVVAIELYGRNGELVENASDVILTVTFPAEDLTPFLGPPERPSPGRFVFAGVPFSLAGEWVVEALVIRPDAFDTRLDYSFENGQAVEVREGIRPSGEVAWWLFGVVLLGVGIVLVGVWWGKGIINW